LLKRRKTTFRTVLELDFLSNLVIYYIFLGDDEMVQFFIGLFLGANVSLFLCYRKFLKNKNMKIKNKRHNKCASKNAFLKINVEIFFR